ncbi:hypothetical protein RHECNPAF_4460043 [Rhizobium etli CNPAF512]|nr:hypothetical protein RHECNPAF_4460043 [Rhizobium etli CNPAF512]
MRSACCRKAASSRRCDRPARGNGFAAIRFPQKAALSEIYGCYLNGRGCRLRWGRGFRVYRHGWPAR